MWIFTRYGFFSVSRHNRQTLAVRARARKHLVLLQNRLPFLKSYPILENTKTDYRYRILVPRNVWVDAMTTLTVEQHWPNVKDECSRFQNDETYTRVMAEVWFRMVEAQRSWGQKEEQLEEENADVKA